MIATVLSVILLLFALLRYNSGRYAWPLFILIFFASDAFIVNLGDPILKYKDFGLLLLVSCSCLGVKRDSSFFRFKGIPGAKISVCFLVFFTLEFLYAYFNNIDTVGNILAVSRDYLYALTYFVFRKAPTNELRKGCVLVFRGVMVACTLFVTQFFTHIELTQSYISEGNLSIGNYRMQSTPPFIALILMTLLFYLRRIKGRWLFIILLFGIYLISQNRTPLIALFLEIGLFILFARRTKHKIAIMIAAMIAFPFVNSLLASRASEEGNTSNFDVPVLSYIAQGNYNELARQSTFMFRIALIAERADYIMSKPEYLLLGVGPMHEGTAQKKFNFHIGTAEIDSRGQAYIGQLNSIDTVWGPLIIRYGLIGLVLHFFIAVWMIIAFYRRRDNPIMMLGFLTYITALAQSFSSGGMFLLLGITTMMGFLIAYDRQLELFNS
jgi:hypothetical protein